MPVYSVRGRGCGGEKQRDDSLVFRATVIILLSLPLEHYIYAEHIPRGDRGTYCASIHNKPFRIQFPLFFNLISCVFFSVPLTADFYLLHTILSNIKQVTLSVVSRIQHTVMKPFLGESRFHDAKSTLLTTHCDNVHLWRHPLLRWRIFSPTASPMQFRISVETVVIAAPDTISPSLWSDVKTFTLNQALTLFDGLTIHKRNPEKRNIHLSFVVKEMTTFMYPTTSGL